MAQRDTISPTIIRKIDAVERSIKGNKDLNKLYTSEKREVYFLNKVHRYSLRVIKEYLLKEKKINISETSLWKIIKVVEKNRKKLTVTKTQSPPNLTNSTILFDKNG